MKGSRLRGSGSEVIGPVGGEPGTIMQYEHTFRCTFTHIHMHSWTQNDTTHTLACSLKEESMVVITFCADKAGEGYEIWQRTAMGQC